MKAYKKIIIFLLLSIIVHLSIISYLENVFFITKPTLSMEVQNLNKFANIAIDSNEQNLNLSFDGKYLSYYTEGTIMIVDTITAKVKEVNIDLNSKLSFYKWISDKEIIIAEKESLSGFNKIKFYSFDASIDKGNKIQYTTTDGNEIIFKPISTSVEIMDVEVSKDPITLFLKVSNEKFGLIKIDNAGTATYIKTSGSSVGNIKLLNSSKSIVYQDNNSKKIKLLDGKEVNLTDIKNPFFIDCKGDTLYVGELTGNKITKIYYGDFVNEQVKWESIIFETTVNKKDIYISPLNGNIYINDDLKGSVTEKITNDKFKETKYKGLIIKIFSKGIATISEGKLYKVNFN